ncbi:MAG TPA: hypothetical protein VMM12_13005 [Longimicrobiales bacterium]|nr:hypothetical protein [Longimicrobiales bacterium]
MARRAAGCLGRLLVLALALVVVAVAWYNRDDLSDAWDRLRGDTTAVSPAIAARADEKLATLGTADGPTSVGLTESEVQSLIEYRWSGFLPQDVVGPKVELSDGRVSLEASVATARFARIDELRDIMVFLPDTAGLRAVGRFVPLDKDHVALEVHELGAGSIPVPSQLIPSVLSRFRGSSAPGLAPNAVAVPLPPGLSNVFVSGDSLVFVSARTAGG